MTTTSYREAAIALWGEAGAYVHDSYARHRHLYPDLPEQLPIVIGITAYGKCLGLTRGYWEHGPRITVASNLFWQGSRFVDDLLIHEMLHAWLRITGQHNKRGGDHDSEPWYAAVRRLSPAVLDHALDIRRGADRKSVRVPNPNYGPPRDRRKTIVRKVRVPDAIQHEDVAGWPGTFRPPDAPRGEPIDCPTY